MNREPMSPSLACALHALAARLGIAMLALVLAGVPAVAEPALWVAKSANATVYLFGTIHILHKGQAWEPQSVAAALAASNELWLEVPDPGNAGEAQALMQQFGFDRDHPLSTKLPRDTLAHVDAVAKTVGIAQGEAALEPMRPWLASVALEDALLVHAGFDPESGVDAMLLHEAVAAGKPVHGFETMAQQMHFFADMAPALEVQLLQNTLQDFDQGPQTLETMVTAWLAGDDAIITRTMVDEIKQPFPALYGTILVDRNEAFAAAIAGMLQGSGVRFVAVGAAHLAGPDSVQAALARRAIPVARVATTH
jgi:uncharacterized protein YbaP (TraB family)